MMPHAARAHVLSLGRVFGAFGLARVERIDPALWYVQTGIGPVPVGAVGEAGGHPEPGVYLPKPVVRARLRP